MNEVVGRDNGAVHPMTKFKRDMEAVATKDLTMLDDKAKARMQSAAVVAVTKDPDLLLADRQSFMSAIRQCAQHGVIPDGNEAVLQVYNTKTKGPNGQEIWVKKVTYLPMIRGIINRVLKSGKVISFWAEVVHEGEAFTLDTSQGDRRPVHALDHFNRKGRIVGAYSLAKFSNGVIDCEILDRSELDKIRAVAKTKNVWDQWFAEKAKVAAMKRHSKRLPLSAEDMDFIQNREETDFDQRDVTPPESTQERLTRIAATRTMPEPHDAITGEIMEPDGPEFDPDAVFPGDAAFTEGGKAHAAALRESHNPHAENPGYSNWLAGYRTARSAAENAE
ncbi:MAG: recombinase RecT [Alphaproteobacteria bacterium]